MQDQPVVVVWCSVAWGTECKVCVGELFWFCFEARDLTKQYQSRYRLFELFWWLSSGFKCFIYTASAVLMSVYVSTLCNMLKSLSENGWSWECECDLIAENAGFVNCLLVRIDRPLCSLIRWVRFLVVSPIYRALQLEHVNSYITLETRPSGMLSFDLKNEVMENEFVKVYSYTWT